MLETLLKLALGEIQKRPELVQEWAGKAVAWFLKQKAEREAEREELITLRSKISEITNAVQRGAVQQELRKILGLP